MSDTVKVYRSAAFAPVAQEIKRFGALHKYEAVTLFDSALLDGAVKRKVYAERETTIGPILHLLHQGRKLVGLKGGFRYTDEALIDSTCLRGAAAKLESEGLELDLSARQRSIIAQSTSRNILAVARHDGYSFAALRRLYKELIDAHQYSELHMYSYLSEEKLEELGKILFDPPRGSSPLDPEKMRLFKLPTPDPPKEPRTHDAVEIVQTTIGEITQVEEPKD